MPWLQLFADTDKHHAAAIEDALLNAGAASVTFKEHIPHGQNENPILEPSLGETPLWQHTRVIGLFDADINTQAINWLLEQQLSLADNSSLRLRWEQLEDKDWEREWMQNYHPIQCAEHLWVCPSWIAPPDPTATNILLDPGLAFGTGTHPTTFLCLQWLAAQALDDAEGNSYRNSYRNNFRNSHIIDYGCGSGILGVAALLLGAQQATGVDIDPQAIIASQDNLQRNHLTADRFTIHLPENCPNQAADIMLANILAGPLAELADTLLALIKPHGKICLSGILSHQAQAVMDAYSHAIDFDPVEQKQEWVRLSGCKR
ncbi:MAG: ribosomal protein L11 methyltransferase [Candidatus Endobugula sp.]|jgi:ribosomal protein L11 methyltransferase